MEIFTGSHFHLEVVNIDVDLSNIEAALAGK